MLDSFKNKEWTSIFVIFIVLYVSTSFYCKNILSESENMLIATAAVLFCTAKRWPFRISILQFFFCTVFSLISLISSILADDKEKLVIHSILVMFCAFVLTSIISFDEFKKCFSWIMVAVCACSLCTFLIQIFAPDSLTIFPKISRPGGFSVYNQFFCVTPIYNRFLRAYGFFWEPGAFQTFINAAIVFVIFGKEMHRVAKLIILYIALALTFSTTGWFVGFVNLAILILVNYHKSGKSFLPLLWMPLLFVGIIAGLIFSPDNIDGVMFGTAKLEAFMDGPSHGSVNSSSVRYDSIYYAIKLFFQSPVIGCGFNGVTDMTQTMYHSMFTCTPLNYFAMYGIFYGTIVGYCIFQIARSLTSFRYDILAILIFVSFMVSTFSEQYVNYLIMDIFIMYGARIASERFVGERVEKNKQENHFFPTIL